MAPVTLTSEHHYMFLGSLGFHLTYFYLIKTFVPYIGNDRKRLSWVLTLATAIVVSVLGPYATFSNLRTVFSEPVPYENYSLTSNQFLAKNAVEAQFYRYDITFQSTMYQDLHRQESTIVTLDPKLSMQQERCNDQGRLEGNLEGSSSFTEADKDRIIAFYKAYDDSRSSPLKSFRHSRWFFDLRFTPSDNWTSQLTVVFFSCYLICDIICGLLHYRERVSFLAGWFHHSLYTCVCYYAVVTGESHAFASFLIIEVPTFILGLGFIFQPLRSDLLFGSSFILLRIFWDFALTHEMVMNRPEMGTSAKAILIFKSAMNFKFLIDWINQQIRLRREKSASIALKASTAAESHLSSVKTHSAEKVAPAIVCSSDSIGNGNSRIISFVHQQQEKRQRQSGPPRIQSSQPSSKIYSSLSSSPSWSSVKSRSMRARTGGLMEDQARVDLIAVH
ncbi:hypothetical protein EDD21DRAFT_438120 [Dissophora ornata]|nr:hypothetical protein EDD21DRAFT_438120 [Dissophora ornata]